LWKWIVALTLHPNVQTDPKRHSSGSLEIPLEAGEKVAKGPQAAHQKRMHVSCLRRPSTGDRRQCQRIPLEYRHLLEMLHERAGGGKSAHTRSNHNSLFAERT